MLHEAGNRADVKPDIVLGVKVCGRELALYDVDGEVLATTDHCPHANCMLSQSGEPLDGIVECACHGSSYDIRTGENVNPPFSFPLATYPVVLQGDVVMVELGEDEPKE